MHRVDPPYGIPPRGEPFPRSVLSLSTRSEALSPYLCCRRT